MPAYGWDIKAKAFVKTCSKCKKEFIGGVDTESSDKIFRKQFSPNVNCRDGFDVYCNDCKTTSSIRTRLRRDGIKDEDIEQLIARWDGRCEICQRPLEFRARSKGNTACIDHDKDTQRVRGILCHFCNFSIGGMNHNIITLLRAVRYLERTSE